MNAVVLVRDEADDVSGFGRHSDDLLESCFAKLERPCRVKEKIQDVILSRRSNMQ